MENKMRRIISGSLLFILCVAAFSESFDINTLKVVKKTLIHISEAGQSGAFAAYKLSDQDYPDTFPYMVQYEPYNDVSNMNSLMSNEITVYNLVKGKKLWTKYLDDVVLTIKRRDNELYIETRKSIYRFRISSGKFLWRYVFSLSELTEEMGLAAERKVYRKPAGVWNERGKTYPVFDVSADGKECVISQDFEKLHLIDIKNKREKTIFTKLRDDAGYRLFNFIFFYNNGFLVKSGSNVYSVSREGKTLFNFRLNENAVFNPPTFYDVDNDGKKEIILNGRSLTWLIDDTGRLIGKTEIKNSVDDCVVSDGKIFFMSGLMGPRGEIRAYDFSMKKLWEFKNPEKVKTGIFFVDLLDFRKTFIYGLKVIPGSDGEKHLLAISYDTAYVISEEGRMEKKIKLGLSGSHQKGMKVVMSWMVGSSSRPAVYNGKIIFPASRVVGKIDKDSDRFHVEDYTVEMQ
ncbi:MAG: hypothetical protein GXP33_07780 [Spirochaetes bacterium]|nr:hypothetical protein [Spirochaetota bacterium]